MLYYAMQNYYANIVNPLQHAVLDYANEANSNWVRWYETKVSNEIQTYSWPTEPQQAHL